jgi:ferredoxin
VEERSETFSERNRVRVQVGHAICVGFGDCVEAAPEAFFLNDENLASIREPDSVDLGMLSRAADVCPVSAILLFDEAGIQVAPDI